MTTRNNEHCFLVSGSEMCVLTLSIPAAARVPSRVSTVLSQRAKFKACFSSSHQKDFMSTQLPPSCYLLAIIPEWCRKWVVMGRTRKHCLQNDHSSRVEMRRCTCLIDGDGDDNYLSPGQKNHRTHNCVVVDLHLGSRCSMSVTLL